MIVWPHMPSATQIQWAWYKKVNSVMGNPDQKVWLFDIHFGRLLWRHCAGHARVKENDQAHQWGAEQPSQVACISEDWRCWGTWDIPYGAKPGTSNYWLSGGERHRKRLNDFLWEDEKKPSLFRPTTGWERAVISQTNMGTVSKAVLGLTSEGWVGAQWAFPSA